jgi:hypothetical protein
MAKPDDDDLIGLGVTNGVTRDPFEPDPESCPKPPMLKVDDVAREPLSVANLTLALDAWRRSRDGHDYTLYVEDEIEITLQFCDGEIRRFRVKRSNPLLFGLVAVELFRSAE